MELKVYVDNLPRLISGINRRTTCQEVIYALAHATGKTGRFVLVEKWRTSERSLAPHDKPLELLLKWGEYAQDVQFVLRCLGEHRAPSRASDETNDVPGAGGSGSISQTANYHSPVTRSLVAAVDRNPGSSNVQFSPTPDLSPVPKMAPFKNENLNFDSKIKYDDDRRLSAEIAENCRFTTNFSDEKIFHGVNPKFGSMTPKNTGSLPRMKRPQQQQQQQLKPSEPEIVYSINAAIKMADEKNTAGAVYNRKPVPPSPALCRSAATTPQPPPPQPLPLPPRSLPPRPPRPPPPSYEETMQRRRRHRPTTPRQSASPLRPPDAPLRHPASPLRQPASPLHQRASPLHERASPLHQSASPLRQPASNVVAAADVSNQDVDFWPLPQLTTNDQDFRESLLATVVAQAKLLERQTSTLETLDKNIEIEMFKLNSMTNNFVDDVIERGKSLSMIGRLEKSMDDDQKDTVAKFELDYHEMTRKKSILKREFDQLSGQLTNLESQINNKRQILCKFDIFRDDDQDQNFDQDECKISTSAHPTVVEEFIKETTPGVWV